MTTDRLGAWRSIGVAGAVAVGLVALTLIVGAALLWGVAGAVLAPGAGGAAESEAEQQERVERFEEAMRDRLAQVGGRSLFYTPPAPSEEDAEPVEVAEEDGPEEDEPKPRRYGGPDVMGVVNGAVVFKGGDVVRLGDERDGVRVVDVDGSPWSVRLEWRGVEFDVPLFERTTDSFIVQRTGDGS